MRTLYVYILTNRSGTLYTEVMDRESFVDNTRFLLRRNDWKRAFFEFTRSRFSLLALVRLLLVVLP